MNERIDLSGSLRDTLVKLGTYAAAHGDVPVSAILTYNDLIIGTGCNDVIQANHVGGHAELNAISAAIKKYGMGEFNQLDRNYLRLITTYEPCAMCRAAIAEYRIHDIRVLKYKSLIQYWKEWLSMQRVIINSHPAGESSMQDSLFRLHPGFHEKNLEQ
ncbi:hypothetical protein BH11BAC2_BH11BAC2_24070 [soil metagenome]